MTVKQFMEACEGHFGRWQRTQVKMAAAEWLSKRSPAYLDELWQMLRDGREVAYGAPDNKAFTDRHVEVCDRLELAAAKAMPVGVPRHLLIAGAVVRRPPVTQEHIDSWPREEGAPGDRWLSHEEAGQAMALVFEKLQRREEVRQGGE